MSASPVTTVPAVRSDVPELLRLIRALAEFERLDHLVVATEELLAVSMFGEHATVEALIARNSADNGRAVGFALFFHTFSTFLGRRGLWLEDLYVESAHRGRGVGRALLLHLAAIARERNCGRFEWSVLDWNAAAIDFYRHLGATVLPEWRIVRVTGDALEKFGSAPGAEKSA